MSTFVILLFLLLLISVPVAVSLAVPSMVMMLQTNFPISIVSQKLFGSVDSVALLAIPFFILAGNLMTTGGISRRLVDFCKTLVGKSYGGLATITILACMFFAAVSGSGVATCAAIGGLMISSMKEEGYDVPWAASVTASAAQIGVIIPPSIPMVLYGIAVNASVSEMFIAGFIPGIMIGISLILVAKFYSKKFGYLGGRNTTFKEKLKAGKHAFWALLMPVIILGGIYSGFCTPTEAAIIASVYALFVGAVIHRELRFKDILNALYNTVVTLGSIMFILAAAGLFAYVLTINNIPQIATDFIISLTNNKYVFLIIVNVLLLIVGMFIDTTPAIIVLAPILLPAARNLGIDPIHFGMIMVCNLAMGLVTPPFGVTLFAAGQISGVSYDRLIKPVLPFIIVLFIDVLLISFIPQISLFLSSII